MRRVICSCKIDGGVSRLTTTLSGYLIETWKPGIGWEPGGADAEEFETAPPASLELAARLGIPPEDLQENNSPPVCDAEAHFLMIDPPGPFSRLAELQEFQDRVQALPANAMNRDLLIEEAERLIALNYSASQEATGDESTSLTNQDDSNCCSCPTNKAVREFARVSYDALARRAVFQLQRVEASGVYGDDYGHNSLWDEYCHESQEGPHDLLSDAWETTIGSVLAEIIDGVPRHEAVLLTIAAVWELDADFEPAPGVNSDLMRQNLQQVLSRMAGARDMARFDPARP